MRLKYLDTGLIPVTEASGNHIPVNIMIHPPCPEIGDLHWKMTADCFDPRLTHIGEGLFKVAADDKATIVALVHKHFLPLYQTAVDVLTTLKSDDDGVSGLYFWEGK